MKKNNSKKNADILFLLILIIILLGGIINTFFNSDDVNYYENRNAYQIPKINIKKILNKEFQDEVELAFSDQIPLAITMKKKYNFINNILTNELFKIIFKNRCDNRYVNLGNSTTVFGCNGNLVYNISHVSDDKAAYDNRIKNINRAIENTTQDIYIYYIEKDTDIDFANNHKSDIYSYLKSNINTNKIYNFEVNNFEEFNNYFYKTDHHWNYKGSYKAYGELVNILTKDEPLSYKEIVCLNNNFSGSKANFSGASQFYKEEFCAYDFDLPEYKVYINGKLGKYGNEKYHLDNPNDLVSYVEYYGGDNGEIIFDNNDNSKENILVIGESYDNAILKLLASHFNKTYSIDLRNYERSNNKKFNYISYINDNKIDKVLLIGNIDYFRMEEFNLEV